MEYNLLDRPFISVLYHDGNMQDVGILDAFQQMKEIEDIYCESPLTTAGLYMLLISIAQRVLKVNSSKKWRELWKDRDVFQKFQRYLEKYRDRFDLYHSEFPFFQSKQKDLLELGEYHPLHRLAFIQANNAALFPHFYDSSPMPMEDAEIARWLIAFQQFAFTCGHSHGNIHTQSSLIQKSEGAVCCVVKSKNLYETILLNLSVNAVSEYSEKEDKPFWERDFNVKDIYNEYGDSPLGYCDALTWMSRSIFIDKKTNSVKIQQGMQPIKYKGSESVLIYDQHPMSLYDADNVFLSKIFKVELWKNYVVFFKNHRDGREIQSCLRACRSLANRKIGFEEDFFVSIYGMNRDKGKIIDVFQEHVPLYGVFIKEGIGEWVVEMIDLAIKGSECVIKAGVLKKHKSIPDYDLIPRAMLTNYYWPILEREFWTFIDKIAKDQSKHEEDFDVCMNRHLCDWKSLVLKQSQNTLYKAIEFASVPLSIVHQKIWNVFNYESFKKGLKTT